MESFPRGHCLIISNRKFDEKTEVRKGTFRDTDNLQEVFEWLHFIVEVKEDFKSDDVKQLLEKYTGMSHKLFDCFVCCILSYEGSKGISGTDGEYLTWEDIQTSFQQCKSLAGKPKLFFIQACYDEHEDRRHFSTEPVLDDFLVLCAFPSGTYTTKCMLKKSLVKLLICQTKYRTSIVS